MQTPKANRPKGGTLIEVIVAALVTGLLLVPALKLLGYTANSYTNQSIRDRASLLAHELMVEILSKKFEEQSNLPLGPDGGETHRVDFDDVDDYHRLTEQPPTGPDGIPRSDLARFQRTTTVDYFHPGSSSPPVEPTRYKQITIQVLFAGTLVSTHRAIRSKRGLTTTTVEGENSSLFRVRTRLQLENGNGEVQANAPLLNFIPEEDQ